MPIAGVKITDGSGTPLIGAVSIPLGTKQVIIQAASTASAYLAYSEGDLSNPFARIIIGASTENSLFRMNTPSGIGTLFLQATEAGGPDSIVTFWLA